MAEPEPKQETETAASIEYSENERRLKYLEFVQLAAIYILVCFSNLYEFAKENSGPLKSGVQTVEATVKAVIGPLYDKFHDVPLEMLRYVDCKVDDYVHELDSFVPSPVKQASSQVRAMASEVHRAGLVGSAKDIAKTAYKRYEPTAKELYVRYEPVAEQYAVAGWRLLNRLPLVPQVADIAVPTVAFWAEKYNQLVSYAVYREYAMSAYLPFIPLDRIAKAFEEAEDGHSHGHDRRHGHGRGHGHRHGHDHGHGHRHGPTANWDAAKAQ